MKTSPKKFRFKSLTSITIVIVSVLLVSSSSNTLPSLFSFQNDINLSTLSPEYDSSQDIAIFNNARVKLSQLDNQQKSKTIEDLEIARVLGESTSNKKRRIAVDLTNQRLLAFEDDDLKYHFLISSGKWGRTPTGMYNIWSKFRYTKMSGGSRALRTYYYLPNVPFVMFFSNDQIAMSRGYSLHGTYWHDNFGHPMSHGCVNMRTEDAGKLFYWTNPKLNGQKSIRASRDNPGTQILIYGKAPRE